MRAANRISWAAALAAAVAVIGGCSPESQDDYKTAGNDLGSAAHAAGQGINTDTRGARQEIEEGTRRAAQSFSKETSNAGAALENDKTSATLKMVLEWRRDLHLTNLKVDASGHEVTLEGVAPTHGQVWQAEQVAKNVLGPTFTVDNQLTVSGG